MNITYIAILAIILYSVTGVGLILRLSQRTQVMRSKNGLLATGLVAALLHAYVLYQNIFVVSGVNLGFFNALSLLGWLIAQLVLLVALFRPVENLGIAVLPLAAVSMILEATVPSTHLVSENVAAGIKAHIVISIIAYSVFSMAGVQAILLAIQNYNLRHKRPGGFVRALPPLETMETLLFQMIGLGFVLQSLSLASGMMYIDDIFAQHLAHKTVLSIIAWLVFAGLLLGRWRFGWRGRTAIRWTMSGFVTLLLAYLGSKWVAEVLLGH